MAAEVTKHPYELLARWDQSGQLAGAQVQWRYVTRDGEAVLGEFLSAAEPIAMHADEEGFPLADILGQLHVDALCSVEHHQAKLADTEAALEAERFAAAAALEQERQRGIMAAQRIIQARTPTPDEAKPAETIESVADQRRREDAAAGLEPPVLHPSEMTRVGGGE